MADPPAYWILSPDLLGYVCIKVIAVRACCSKKIALVFEVTRLEFIEGEFATLQAIPQPLQRQRWPQTSGAVGWAPPRATLQSIARIMTDPVTLARTRCTTILHLFMYNSSVFVWWFIALLSAEPVRSLCRHMNVRPVCSL